jgi:hypothetical protein
MQRIDRGTEIGTKVFIRSNEDEPIKVGRLVDWFDADGKFSEAIPVVKVGGKRYYACGIVVVYTKDAIAELNRLSPKQQWEQLCYMLFPTMFPATGKVDHYE